MFIARINIAVNMNIVLLLFFVEKGTEKITFLMDNLFLWRQALEDEIY